MSLPPLSKTPNVSRLLGPGEVVIYTGRLHPIHGVQWLAGFIALLLLARFTTPYLLIPALGCLQVYILPFLNTEIAVTSDRLLVRHGRFSVHLDVIDPGQLDHYQLHQNIASHKMHFGTLILNLVSAGGMQKLVLEDVWHPLSLLEALTTLNPLFRKRLH